MINKCSKIEVGRDDDMYYCERCRSLNENDCCDICGKSHLKEVEPDDKCFLIEKEVMWAEMLIEVLENNQIPYTYTTSMGAGMALKVGPLFERYQIFVPYAYIEQARDCVRTLFKEESEKNLD